MPRRVSRRRSPPRRRSPSRRSSPPRRRSPARDKSRASRGSSRVSHRHRGIPEGSGFQLSPELQNDSGLKQAVIGVYTSNKLRHDDSDDTSTLIRNLYGHENTFESNMIRDKLRLALQQWDQEEGHGIMRKLVQEIYLSPQKGRPPPTAPPALHRHPFHTPQVASGSSRVLFSDEGLFSDE